MADLTPTSFAYEAQSADGRTFRGTLDAAALPAAAEQLASLHLRVTRLAPVRGRATLGETDLLRVNQQLAHLTAGGLPLERGLRLIADELPRRQARAVRAIAADLEGGAPIGDALAGRSGAFPPAYGALLAAGVAANDLPGVLANLGRHVELMQRLRGAVWRAAAYPLMVAAALLVVMLFVWGYVMPQFAKLNGYPSQPVSWWSSKPYGYASGTSASLLTDPDLSWVPAVARGVSYAVIAILAIAVGGAFVVVALGRTAAGRRWAEPALRALPVVGPVVRWNGVARWCEALHLGVSAGLDLPAALALAGRAGASAASEADAAQMVDAVRAGTPGDPVGPLRLLPPTVPATIALAAERGDLPAAAATLARMYREQAEVRLAVVPAVLSPVLLLLTALCVTAAAASALMPLVLTLRMLMR